VGATERECVRERERARASERESVYVRQLDTDLTMFKEVLLQCVLQCVAAENLTNFKKVNHSVFKEHTVFSLNFASFHTPCLL